jgi:hypothetical protein
MALISSLTLPLANPDCGTDELKTVNMNFMTEPDSVP